MKKGLNIIGTGAYLPEFILDNQKLEELVETSDEWITTRTGIKKRCISTGEPTWYMAKKAAEKALDMAKVKAEDIDLVMVSTATPDYFFPSVSCVIQGELGMKNAACFDVNAACTGFIYCLDIAEKYLTTGTYETILIVSSETLSKVTDYTDRSTCVLFGDGAGACVLSAKGEGRMLASYLKADGTGGGTLTSKALEVNNPFVSEDKKKKLEKYPQATDHYLRMQGQEVFKFATRAMVEACKVVVEAGGLTFEDIDYLIPHQANTRILDYAAKKLGMAPEKVSDTLVELGNTSSSSIPIALDLLMRQGSLQKKNRVVLTGFGSGLTYGAILLEL